jgi:hypothetical protein
MQEIVLCKVEYNKLSFYEREAMTKLAQAKQRTLTVILEGAFSAFQNLSLPIFSNSRRYHQIGYLTIVQRVICVYNDAIVAKVLKAQLSKLHSPLKT